MNFKFINQNNILLTIRIVMRYFAASDYLIFLLIIYVYEQAVTYMRKTECANTIKDIIKK